MNRLTQSSLALSLVAIGSLIGTTLGTHLSAQAQVRQPDSFLIASTPVTYMTVINNDQLVVQITDGEFYFHGWLERTNGNMYVGEDEQVRVMYDRGTSRMVVINRITGDEFYNYTYSMADEGSL